MQMKRRNRYYCDFCNKSGGSGGHMKTHERHCTMNPDRYCRVCERAEYAQTEMPEALKLLPNPDDYKTESEYGGWEFGNLNKVIEEVMPKLRDITEDCPICIFAVLRQKGISPYEVESFKYKEELSSLWSDINEHESQEECY